MALKAITYILPAAWACGLINNDWSDDTTGEQEQAEAFLRKHRLPYPVSCSEDAYFSWSNDANTKLGGNVLEYTFLHGK